MSERPNNGMKWYGRAFARRCVRRHESPLAAYSGVPQTVRELKRLLTRFAWCAILGALATTVWLFVSPLHSLAVSGRLPEFVQAQGTSNDALVRMWRLQLPGTLLSCCVFSLLALRAAGAACPKWGRASVWGAIAGGCLGLLMFTSPPPGLPLTVWALAFYLTGVPALAILHFVSSLLPSLAMHSPIAFSGLVSYWPIVVTGVLVTIAIVSGATFGKVLSAVRQNNALQRCWTDPRVAV